MTTIRRPEDTAGVYFCFLRAGAATISRNLILVR